MLIDLHKRDHDLMGEALNQARAASAAGEVPVGAVIVWEGRVIAQAHNQTQQLGDPLAHAEVLALRQAARAIGNHRLEQAELFVTLEPCIMCIGALLIARIDRLVYALRDRQIGTLHRHDLARLPNSPHHIREIKSGVRQAESLELLQQFFNSKR